MFPSRTWHHNGFKKLPVRGTGTLFRKKKKKDINCKQEVKLKKPDGCVCVYLDFELLIFTTINKLREVLISCFMKKKSSNAGKIIIQKGMGKCKGK